MSFGCSSMFAAAKISGGLIAVTGPFGAAFAAGVGTCFMPGVATVAAKATVVAAIFSGSFLLSIASIPLIGIFLLISVTTDDEAMARRYERMAIIVGVAYLTIAAAIGISVLGAASVGGVTIATTALCALAGTGALMLMAAVTTGLLMTCVTACFDGMGANESPSWTEQLWCGR